MSDANFFMQYLQDSAETKERIRFVYERMCADNTAEIVFYDGTVSTAEEFVADILRPGSLPFMVFWEGNEAGFAWFNTIEGKSARGHFVVFREYWGRGRTETIGREIYKYILTRKDSQGYIFDVLLGLTPVRNKLAWRLGLLCGGREIGIIPHGAYIAKEHRTEGARLAVVTRETIGLEEAD